MPKILKTCFVLIFFYFGFHSTEAQQMDLQNLSLLFEKLYASSDDSIKNNINSRITKEILNGIENTDNMIELKKIKGLFALISADNKVKILTWGYSLSDNSNQYAGVVCYYLKESNRFYTEELIHTEKKHENFDQIQYTSKKWYGAVYYDIVNQKYKGKNYYLLLGYDGKDDFTNIKLIDALEMNDDEYLKFGCPIFDLENSKPLRLVFEYAERVSMILKYDEKMKMIIWDHLSPSKPELKGYYQYYGPDMTFDALFFEKGLWKYSPDILINR
jgi:hypothetical protein